ncbi:sugar phosphate isomerase/epimerase family protein [Vagococcus sp.]|uniref:sugar phosphate isomerase/epimerase family protein n=1 Tax=Vagococcus sp. TaxID=1933889 RepID=UPI003F9AE438
MDKKLVLNFLVFEEDIKQGILQQELLKRAKGLGFSKVELRREYFKDISQEISVIKEIAKTEKIELFYSVPDEIFIEGKLNPKLKAYLKEAEEMGVSHIKWNIGDFTTESSVDELGDLITKNIEINVENDQTKTSGTSQAISDFMKVINKKGLDIGYVYDLGNWRFVGEDELMAAKKLKEFVRYIHLKDVAYEAEQPKAACLDQGSLDWRKVLAILPSNVPVAIEYPTTSAAEIITAKKLVEEVL